MSMVWQRLRRYLVPRTLKRKIVLVFLLASFLGVANVAVLLSLLRESDTTAATLNMAGKMRMLSQRVGLHAVVAQQIPYLSLPAEPALRAEFWQAYRALRDGGSAFGLTVPPLENGQRVLLANIYQDWQEYMQALDALHSIPSNQMPRPELMHAMAKAVLASEQLLDGTEALLDDLVLYAGQVQQQALFRASALFMLDLLMLMMLWLVAIRNILRPVRSLSRQGRELAAGNYAARSALAPVDELGRLGKVLNDLAAHIGQLLLEIRVERDSLRRAKSLFEGLGSNTVAGIYMLDRHLCFTYANDRLAQMLGYERRQLEDNFHISQIFSPDTFELIKGRIEERLAGNTKAVRYEMTAIRQDGRPIDIEIFGSVVSLRGQGTIIGIMLDITERKQAEMSVRRAALVYENTSEAMVVTDADGYVLDINPAFTAITGYGAAEVIGRRMNILSSGLQSKEFYVEMWDSLLKTGYWKGDIWNRRKSGEEFIERLTINTSYNSDGSVNCRIGLFSDVTEKRRREASIWRQAHFDHLTQLPNRQMFQENLRRSIEQSRISGLPFALIFLDLDLFKEVNDTFGHDQGDELLRLVAQRLSGCVRSSDQVARLGGDEFTLIIQDLHSPEEVKPICRKILDSVSKPYTLATNVIHISCSVGVTFYPGDADNPTDLLKYADLAMYAAKDKGRNQYCVFSANMQQSAQQRRTMLHDMQLALDQRQFVLHYQPIIDMNTGLIVKAEALIRWEHPVRGLIGPVDFIPLAEDSGLIVPIGEFVFHEAARQAALWRHELKPDFEISINVSPVQFQSDSLDIGSWSRALQAQSLPGSAITMEITERLLIDTEEQSSQRLLAFRDAGIQVALDDFGTGYSSLSYLKRFHIDYIKIDQSFVQNLTPDSEDLALCQAMIVMAHKLGMKVIAEGINSHEQHELLLASGCDYGQGYLYAKPLPAREFAECLTTATFY